MTTPLPKTWDTLPVFAQAGLDMNGCNPHGISPTVFKTPKETT